MKREKASERGVDAAASYSDRRATISLPSLPLIYGSSEPVTYLAGKLRLGETVIRVKKQ